MADPPPDDAPGDLDPLAKKKALRMLTNGLYIVGAADGDDVHGMLGSWVSQCSFDPPLVMAGIRKDTRTHRLIEASGAFSINLLSKDQRDVAEDFLKGVLPDLEAGRLGDHAFERGRTGCPLLAAAPAWFECEVRTAVGEGDHTVFIGEVVGAGFREFREPLTLWDTGWHYGG